MDILKKHLAPISPEGWEEIEQTARETLQANLSARKSVDVIGPKGLDYTSVNLGRLKLGSTSDDRGVHYGVYQVQPLVESRLSFTVKTWELDNLARGARDIDLDDVVQAARSMAKFEEEAIYNGFKDGSISGLEKSAEFTMKALKADSEGLLDALSDAQLKMRQAGVDGGADLIVDSELWKFLGKPTRGGTLRSIVERQIAGKVIFSEHVHGAMLLANRGGDLELVIGQDFSIGYHHHNSEEVHLFLTESFTFSVITPEAIVHFKG
jgi:uncharacterized linocin/CFP29 family protein